MDVFLCSNRQNNTPFIFKTTGLGMNLKINGLCVLFSLIVMTGIVMEVMT